MKIAVISDIHGNIEALDAVLNDIKKENCEKIFCLGDLAMAGSEPSLTIHKIQTLLRDLDFILIQGNTDLYLSSYSEELLQKIKNTNEIMANAFEADSKELSDEDKQFLKDLPDKKELVLNGIKILLVHGSPRKIDENIFPNLPIEKVQEMISDTDADLIFCGHTHMPCGYQTNTKQTVVNVGSVGRPFSEEPKSCYVVLDLNDEKKSFEIKHKLINYDYESAASKLEKRGFDGSFKLAEMLRKAASRYPQ